MSIFNRPSQFKYNFKKTGIYIKDNLRRRRSIYENENENDKRAIQLN